MDFNSIKESVTNTASKAVKVSNDAIEITKLIYKINEQESKIKKIYTNIGEMFYDSIKDDKNYLEDAKEKCDEIDNLIDEVNELKEKLNSLRKLKKCSECGCDNPKGSNFCKECGTKFE